MYAQVKKPKENKSKAVANSVSQKKINGSQGFGFVDNRSESLARRNIQTQMRRPSTQKKESSAELPSNLKSGIENLSGYSITEAKVYRNSSKTAALQASAYSPETNIHLAPRKEKFESVKSRSLANVQRKINNLKTKPSTNQPRLQPETNTGLTNPFKKSGEYEHYQAEHIPLVTGNVIQLTQFTEQETGGYGQLDTDIAKEVLDFLSAYQANDPDIDSEVQKKVWEDIETQIKEHKYGVGKEQAENIRGFFDQIKETLPEKDQQPAMMEEEYPELEQEEYWKEEVGTRSREQIEFLEKVVRVAREIVPIAFNREIEKEANLDLQDTNQVVTDRDWVNDKYLCVEEIVKKFSGILQRANLGNKQKYIHPAVHERIIILVNKVVEKIVEKNSVQESALRMEMAGQCKTYATLVYGLIIQNDREKLLDPKIQFMHEHVYVSVKVGGQDYAIDAWLQDQKSQGTGVTMKSEHLNLFKERQANKNSKKWDEKQDEEDKQKKIQEQEFQQQLFKYNTKEITDNINKQYQRYKEVYKLWKEKEAEFETYAKEFLSTPKHQARGTGSM
ncbi:MAG: hypothetical protein F6K40_14920 [Okeania sp. SIO3I5]|uniref:hypothetical protein n=1 Tax=Okeania sp. SIO3I5 TaxID=2607805 RepID=UPI0013BE7D6B|nr:hypothetical protein [Okeania sp. SIO3I5]NEQ37489.1 hypothetical protein [Okeania sp. SIO3I5]